jgi:hypothetical protein
VQFGAENRGGKDGEAERRCRGNERASRKPLGKKGVAMVARASAVLERRGEAVWGRTI